MSLDETLAAIDTAVGCQWCGGPLKGSVSDDFCCEEHQVAWHHARADQEHIGGTSPPVGLPPRVRLMWAASAWSGLEMQPRG